MGHCWQTKFKNLIWQTYLLKGHSTSTEIWVWSNLKFFFSIKNIKTVLIFLPKFVVRWTYCQHVLRSQVCQDVSGLHTNFFRSNGHFCRHSLFKAIEFMRSSMKILIVNFLVMFCLLCYATNTPQLRISWTHSVLLAFGSKSSFKNKSRAGFRLQNEARSQLWFAANAFRIALYYLWGRAYFSALCRITNPRSTMTERRLIFCCLLNIHSTVTD